VVALQIFEPVYDTSGGAPRGLFLYNAMGRIGRQAPRATVEEEGGDVEVGTESVRVTYLDPRVLPGWFARLYGQWFVITGARGVPPYGIEGDLQLTIHAPIQVIQERLVLVDGYTITLDGYEVTVSAGA